MNIIPSETDIITVRRATEGDIPLLAKIERIASIPPFAHSFWDDLVAPTGAPTLAFLEAMFAVGASAWGGIGDFIILERNGQAVAACAIFAPDPASNDHRPLRVERLPAIGEQLGWTVDVTQAFMTSFSDAFGDPDAPPFAPQAPLIIESVGVLPEARGMGLGRRLIEEAIAVGKASGHEHMGIMVIHGNEPARRLYDSVGFQPYITYHADYFGDEFPGLTKYRLNLK